MATAKQGSQLKPVSAFPHSIDPAKFTAPWQNLIRPLTENELAELEASIREHGILQPVLVTAEHQIIDGYHRCQIAKKLGITDVPARLIVNFGPDVWEHLAAELNDCRRQQSANDLAGRAKSRAERRAAIAAALIKTPGKSDRAIADDVEKKTGRKPSATTVGTVREELSSSGKLDSCPRTTGKDGKSRARKKSPDAGIREALRANPKRTDQELAKEFKCHPLRVDRIRRSIAAKADKSTGADLFAKAPENSKPEEEKPARLRWRSDLLGMAAVLQMRVAALTRLAKLKAWERDPSHLEPLVASIRRLADQIEQFADAALSPAA